MTQVAVTSKSDCHLWPKLFLNDPPFGGSFCFGNYCGKGFRKLIRLLGSKRP